MKLDKTIEKVARAICADIGKDPDEMIGPGTQFRPNPDEERWRHIARELNLRFHLILLKELGIVTFDKE